MTDPLAGLAETLEKHVGCGDVDNAGRCAKCDAIRNILREAEAVRPVRPELPPQRSIALLRSTLSTLCHYIWHKELRPGEHLWSIPVDKERDFDCILSDAIDELAAVREALTAPLSISAQKPDLCPETAGDEDSPLQPLPHEYRCIYCRQLPVREALAAQPSADIEAAFKAGYHCVWSRDERRYYFDPALKPGDADSAFKAWLAERQP
jgi:hypothetical protein